MLCIKCKLSTICIEKNMLNEVKTRNIISGLIPRYQPLSCWHKNRVRLVPFQKFWASRTCIQQVVLSDIFWKKWRFTFLGSLQKRRKRSARKPYLKTGDIILLREKNTHRNLWPTGIVERPIESDDTRQLFVSSGMARPQPIFDP